MGIELKLLRFWFRVQVQNIATSTDGKRHLGLQSYAEIRLFLRSNFT